MNLELKDIKNALSKVLDPDLKRDLITLKMIENIKIENNNIYFDLVLTTPACPLKAEMKLACEQAIKALDNKVDVHVNLTSRVVQSKIIRGESLSKVKNIIAVMSGKGGVGKSTIAVNLAVSLAKTGAKVGIIDADIYGPSIPMMFDIELEHPIAIQKGDKTMIEPIEKYGVKVISVGFFVDPSKAILWRGPMASNALKQLFNDTDWGELDYLVCDMPPGTGDIHMTLIQDLKITAAIIVGTPNKVAIADVHKAIAMLQNEHLQTPIIGIVENMSYFTPAELPNNKYYIFGKSGCTDLSNESGIPLLAQIPLVQSIAEAGESGNPIKMMNENPIISNHFQDLASKVAQSISIINTNNK